MKIWPDQIRKPHVSIGTSFVLQHNDFICHKQTPFFDAPERAGTHVELILDVHTFVLPLYEVKAMKSVRAGMEN